MKTLGLVAMGVFAVGTCYAAKTWSSPDSEVKAKFSTTRIGVTKSADFHYLQGKISVSYKSASKFFKKPILRVVVLTEENGARAVRDTIMDEPNLKIVSDRESDGGYWCESWWNNNWVTKTTTMPEHWDSDSIGKNVPDPRCRTIAEISSNQVEVAKAKYAVANYLGLPLDVQVRQGLKGTKFQTMFGYCRFNWNEGVKMLGYRLEVWQGGQCVAYWDSISASEIAKYEIPEDWHVSFAYPDKFQYRSPWAAKKVVRQ